MKNPDNAGRLRIWIPVEDRWVQEALRHRATLREARQGVPSSVSREVLLILKNSLSWYEKEKVDATKEDQTAGNSVS